jgi:hypothetical protein
MGIPNITTNLSGFGCFMEDLLETPEDYGCYIVDRRGQGVEESVNELVSLVPSSKSLFLDPARCAILHVPRILVHALTYRLTKSTRSLPSPDDNVLTSETEPSVFPSFSTGSLSVWSTSKPVNSLFDVPTPIPSTMKSPTLPAFSVSAHRSRLLARQG